MNIYLRYFNDETLVHTLPEATEFLAGQTDFELTDDHIDSISTYLASNTTDAKHVKVNEKNYFIVIKTSAETMEEFKERQQQRTSGTNDKEAASRLQSEERPGWYHVTMAFKRVMPIGETGKSQYVDTEFEVKLKAHTIEDAYRRVVDHLRTRSDVDPRSQFPSIKGKNFKAQFLGFPNAV